MKRHSIFLISMAVATVGLASCSLADLFNTAEPSSSSSTEVYFSPEEPSLPSVDSTPKYICTFYGYDGQELYRTEVRKGESVEYNGETPTRPEWQGGYFVFTGWDKPMDSISADTDFLPLFDEVTKSYTVTFLARGEVVQQDVLPFQSSVSFRGKVSSLGYTEGNVEYSFASWGRDISTYKVTEDITFEAQFVASTIGLQYSRYGTHNAEGEYIEGFQVSGNNLHDETVLIPEIHEGLPVLRIADNGFSNNQFLCAISCPKSLLEIGSYAFYNDSNLAQVDLEPGVLKIDPYAFYATPSLEMTVLKPGLKELGAYAFSHSGLVSLALPTHLEVLGEYAFANCPNLKELDLTKIEMPLSSGLFSNDPALKRVELNAGMTVIPDYLFSNCHGLESVALPRELQTIGAYAFQGCNNLKNLEIPAKTERINAYAFQGCTALDSVSFLGENLETVDDYAFQGCVKLQSIALPSSILIIGNEAFAGSDLKTIGVGNSLTRIGFQAFDSTPLFLDQSNYRDGMYYLFSYDESAAYVYRTSESSYVRLREETKLFAEGLYFPTLTLQIPNTLCDDLSFLRTISLNELILEDESVYQVREGCIYHGDTLVRCFDSRLASIELPTHVKTIGQDAFSGLYGLRQVSLNEGLERIERNAFVGTGIRFVIMPSTIFHINSYLFDGSTSCYVLLPTGVDPIFSSGRSNVRVYDGFEGQIAEENGFSYFVINGEAIAYSYAWKDYEVIVPETLGGYPVTELAPNFSWNESGQIAEKIHLPSSLVRIGQGAMRDLNNDTLKTVELGANIRVIETEGMKIGSGYVVLPESLESVQNYGISGRGGKIFSELSSMPTDGRYDSGFYEGATVYWYSDTPIYDGLHWHYTGSGSNREPSIYVA